MRTSKAIRAAIEAKHALINKCESRIYSLKDEINKLENTLSKAVHRERLASSNTFIDVVSCVREQDVKGFGLPLRTYVITTKKGFRFGATKAWKIGKHKITEEWFKQISRPRCLKCDWQLVSSDPVECYNPECENNPSFKGKEA